MRRLLGEPLILLANLADALSLSDVAMSGRLGLTRQLHGTPSSGLSANLVFLINEAHIVLSNHGYLALHRVLLTAQGSARLWLYDDALSMGGPPAIGSFEGGWRREPTHPHTQEYPSTPPPPPAHEYGLFHRCALQLHIDR